MDTDAGKRVKVVCRYQQYRAARRIVERLRTGRTPEERSGVVWHTQGSGKSLTMVFVARMLRAARDLEDFKILLVNDRVDLEDQLAGTAKLIGGKVNVIESTARAARAPGTEASDINMVMVHKFMERAEAVPLKVAEALATYRALPSGETFGVVNPSERILLMIDEAHRTQGSDLGDNLFEAFPNATRIAFTGTPLITEQHGNKRTVKRFGEYIDTYKLMDAVHDGATLQILYEGRTADTALKDKHGFDTKFEDLFRERSDEELAAIKKKYGASGDILEAEQRIAAIARDLVDHYIDNILPDGFKAQVVCHSKLAAIRYQKAIREALAERLDREKLKPDPRFRADPPHRLPQGRGGRLRRRDQRAGRHHRGAQGGEALERGGELLQALRPGRPRQGADRHRLPDRLRHAADRLRRAGGAGDVHRQAAARAQPAAGHRPRQPGGEEQAPRLHRRLHRPRQPPDAGAQHLFRGGRRGHPRRG